jgi:hypothetical protein
VTRFPHGIPDDIAYGTFHHREPHVGDNGIRFKLQPGFEQDPAIYEASPGRSHRDCILIGRVTLTGWSAPDAALIVPFQLLHDPSSIEVVTFLNY